MNIIKQILVRQKFNHRDKVVWKYLKHKIEMEDRYTMDDQLREEATQGVI